MNTKGLSTEKVGGYRGRDHPARNKREQKYCKIPGKRGAMSIRPRPMCPQPMCPRPNLLDIAPLGQSVPWTLCP